MPTICSIRCVNWFINQMFAVLLELWIQAIVTAKGHNRWKQTKLNLFHKAINTKKQQKNIFFLIQSFTLVAQRLRTLRANFPDWTGSCKTFCDKWQNEGEAADRQLFMMAFTHVWIMTIMGEGRGAAFGSKGQMNRTVGERTAQRLVDL